METTTYIFQALEVLKKLDIQNEVYQRNYEFISKDEHLISVCLECELPNGNPIKFDEVTVLDYPSPLLEKLGYDGYNDWVDQNILMGDCYYYAKPSECFSKNEAILEASKLGKPFVIIENLS